MTEKKNHFIFLGAFIIALTIIYSNHFYNPFHFDDSHTISNNTYIRDLSNFFLFFKDGATISSLPSNQSYRPLTCVSYAVDYWIGGGLTNTFYFHLSTFIWFILQIVLMYFLFLKMMRYAKEHEWTLYAAMFATMWYALNTSMAETINYICARTDSISTLGVVASMFLYVFYPNKRKWYLYLIPAALANLVKPTALVFAPLLLCYILLFEKNIAAKDIFNRARRKDLFAGIRLTIPAFIVSAVFYYIAKVMTPPTFVAGTGSLFNYIITQPMVSFHYFRTFFLPTQLSADTDWGPLPGMMDWRFFGGMLFLFTLLVIIIRTSNHKETRPIAYGLLWFIIALVPTSVVPLSEVMNDHRIFFPFVGLALAAGWAVALLIFKYKEIILSSTANKFYVFAALFIVLVTNALGTYERNKIWSSDESLWLDVTEKSPKNGRGMMNYGLALMAKGNYEGAEKYFLKAKEYIPYYSYIHVNLGVLRNAQGRLEEAEKHFQDAMQIAPNSPEPLYFYANWLRNQGRGAEAIPFVQKALQLSPGHGYSKQLLDELVANPTTGESPLVKAEKNAEENPTAEKYLNLSLQYFRARQFEKCIDASQKALKLKPDYAAAYNNMCSAYNELLEWDKAIAACENAVRIDPNFQLAKNNLAYSVQSKKAKKGK